MPTSISSQSIVGKAEKQEYEYTNTSSLRDMTFLMPMVPGHCDMGEIQAYLYYKTSCSTENVHFCII